MPTIDRDFEDDEHQNEPMAYKSGSEEEYVPGKIKS